MIYSLGKRLKFIEEIIVQAQTKHAIYSTANLLIHLFSNLQLIHKFQLVLLTFAPSYFLANILLFLLFVFSVFMPMP